MNEAFSVFFGDFDLLRSRRGDLERRFGVTDLDFFRRGVTDLDFLRFGVTDLDFLRFGVTDLDFFRLGVKDLDLDRRGVFDLDFVLWSRRSRRVLERDRRDTELRLL